MSKQGLATCVCGSGCQDKPNPDCERCQLIADNEKLRAENNNLRERVRRLIEMLDVRRGDPSETVDWGLSDG